VSGDARGGSQRIHEPGRPVVSCGVRLPSGRLAVRVERGRGGTKPQRSQRSPASFVCLQAGVGTRHVAARVLQDFEGPASWVERFGGQPPGSMAQGAKAKGVGQAAVEQSASGPAQLGSELGSANEASRSVLLRSGELHLAPRAASPPSGGGEVRGGRGADVSPGGSELFGASIRAEERSSHAEPAGQAEHAAETLWWSFGEGSPAGQPRVRGARGESFRGGG